MDIGYCPKCGTKLLGQEKHLEWFIQTECRISLPFLKGEGFSVKTEELYKRYKSFCEKNFFSPIKQNYFSRELRILHPTISIKKTGTKDNRYKIFTGIK